jgi:serralysin
VANFLQSFGGNDTLLGGGGDDHLIGGDDDDWIYLDPGADRLEGGDGYDTLVFSSPTIFDFAGGLFSGDAAGDLGWSGFEAIRGSAGDDRIVATTASANVAVFYGGAGNDAIAGGAGADTLHGEAGDDRLQGHDADDLLRPGTGSDTVDGGLGVDTVSYSDLGAAVRLDLARTIPQATGAGGLDTLTGVENAEGGAGADTLRGDAGPNALWGLGANDLLIGRGGSDRLDGGAGTDTLTGGAGGDVFVFGSALGPDNVDHITDYGAALDRLYLIGPAGPFAILPAGTLAPAALDILGDATAPTAATRVVYDPATGTLAFDPDGTGAAAAQPFAVLDNLPATLAPTQIDVGP